MLDVRGDEVDQLLDRARRTLSHRLDRATDEIAGQLARARAMSPLATLQRGYAVVQDEAGHVVSSVDSITPGAMMMIRVSDGRIHATATATATEPADEPPIETTAERTRDA